MVKYFVLMVLLLLGAPVWAEDLFVKVPVWFPMMMRVPIIKIEIEGVVLKMVVDLGAGCDLMLRKEVLDRISDKLVLSEVDYLDVLGNSYTTPLFQIPLVKIQDFEFSDLIALEEKPDFIKNGSVANKGILTAREALRSTDGRIGLGMLCRYNILFDFPRGFFMEVKGIFPIGAHMVEIPFEVTECGVVFTIDTDFGRRRFILDTGASLSFVNASLIKAGLEKEWVAGINRYKCRKFIIGEKDFGCRQLCLLNISERFENDFDGILGVDFFRDHKIYLDFNEYKAFIE